MTRAFGAALLVLLPGCWVLVWDGWTGRQQVDLSPIMELRLSPEIASLRPAFPHYGYSTGEPEFHEMLEIIDPGRIETLCLFIDGKRLIVLIRLYRTFWEASGAFLRECNGTWYRRDTRGHVYGGEEDNRYCITEIREEEDSVYLGSHGTGTFVSYVVVQKGRVVIKIEEKSSRHAADKDRVIAEISEALRGLAAGPVRAPLGGLQALRAQAVRELRLGPARDILLEPRPGRLLSGVGVVLTDLLAGGADGNEPAESDSHLGEHPPVELHADQHEDGAEEEDHADDKAVQIQRALEERPGYEEIPDEEDRHEPEQSLQAPADRGPRRVGDEPEIREETAKQQDREQHDHRAHEDEATAYGMV